MPEPYYKQEAYPRPGELWLDKAAKEGKLIVCRCTRCKRIARYLAADLLPILGPAHRASRTPPFPCGQCGRRDTIDVSCVVPSAGDFGALEVRRPAGIRQVQTWKTVMLGDKISNDLKELKDMSQWLVGKANKRPPRAR